ncbi:MFS transporter [Picrophilus oshimae]|uniref:MFS-type transporter involved in bile tolerance, Atg22 family n=1 Tax=Picrophilus torridus (strain ATCC 700027 / DSM 9790 / JCM 10055 / NBRC 100828 / KAW 2/3) TaxID=1122961 RepID=A0A8G2FWW7_PICTO|nr:MFS transporter [Picrophilus oshimae]SMD30992.1 MFS-type transporter involved in bile tolerance, Atg22 family [Picrophilus oshimae DSM 9789]
MEIHKTMVLIGSRSFIVAAGASTAASFIGVYGVLLGASPIEMGFLQALANSISNGAQILFGRISDASGLRKPWIIGASAMLAVLWFSLSYVTGPLELILIYSVISLSSAMITVNWFALLTDLTGHGNRGSFMARISNLSSIGNMITLIILTFFLKGDEKSLLIIPFTLASISYVLSAIIVSLLKESKKRSIFRKSFIENVKDVKKHGDFYRYLRAMMFQGFFWSMAWPIFPITVIAVRNFTLPMIAVLTVVNITATIIIQIYTGRTSDRGNRVPLIFINRLLLGGIPFMYAFFVSFYEFIFIEVYSGVLSGIQNVVMNSYLMDLLPDENRAEYISIMNGFNGIVYFFGSVSGGELLEYLIGFIPLHMAVEYSFIIIGTGRIITSFLFINLNDPGRNKRTPLLNILFRLNNAGLPSGSIIRQR